MRRERSPSSPGGRLVFDQLDELFGEERGPLGQPSRTDFLVYELPDAMERFATDWDELAPLEPEVGGGRVLIQPGMLVHSYAIYGLLVLDESIELVGLNIRPFRSPPST